MKHLIPVLLGALALQGCATAQQAHPASVAGESHASCVWGGTSAEEDAYCAEQRWGTEGYLRAVNERATRDLPNYDGATPCQEHVARLEALLKDRKDLKTSPIYSCPNAASDDRCHLSLLVTDQRGRQYVLDNGAVFHETEAAAGVGEFSRFIQLVHDYHIVARASEVEMYRAASPAAL